MSQQLLLCSINLILFLFYALLISFSNNLTPSRTLGEKCLRSSSPSHTVVANGLLPSTLSLSALYVPSPFLSSVRHRAAIFLPCVCETSCISASTACADLSGTCSAADMSCFEKAASRSGGTERIW
ncbi:hypothetical protein CTA2_10749 [Colletotrichum tanaceti]|nr:hypothetical protein CTA2_10749 [Colletotrichum tanaceti]